MSKCLKDKNGVVHVDNIQENLLTKLITRMQQSNSGHCVCRQFVYDKSYTMILIDVCSQMDTAKVIVTVALWPDEADAGYHITRQIPFYVKTENIHVWESFCEAVSGKKAIWENDLIGNVFVGRIVKNKATYDGKITYFENLVVDKFIDKLALNNLIAIVNQKSKSTGKTTMKKQSTIVKDLLEDDAE